MTHTARPATDKERSELLGSMWIPTKDRLPEMYPVDRQRVSDSYEEESDYYLVQMTDSEMCVAKYCHDTWDDGELYGWIECYTGEFIDPEKVIAWMPMPEPYKEVFSLRVFGELPFAQIGELFGKSDGWARLIFYRAKNELRRRLDE